MKESRAQQLVSVLCASVYRGLCKSIHLVKVLIATSVDESGAELLAPVLSQSLSLSVCTEVYQNFSLVYKSTTGIKMRLTKRTKRLREVAPSDPRRAGGGSENF